MRSLHNKVVVITGASAGIGRECAFAFRRAGAHVVIAARRTDRLEEIRSAIQSDGGKCLAVSTDVADPAQIQRLLDATLEHFGRVDVWINNAGFGQVSRFEDITPEEMARLWLVNYMGAFHGCRTALQQMRRQESGHIMNVSSMVARFPLPLNSGYTAAKCALTGLSEALDMEMEGTGIRVTAVLPGVTESEFTDAMVTKIPSPNAPRRIPITPARRVAERMVACALRPRSHLYFVPVPPLTLALTALFPGLWRAIACRYLRHRLSGNNSPEAPPGLR